MMTDRMDIPKRPLGRTGEEVTIFGLGGEGVLRTVGRMKEAVAVIHRALEQGVNYYDSAPAYAGCLDYLGEGLAGRREGVFVASKTHDRTRDGSLRLLDQTLERLRTDRLDLWQLHDLRSPRDLDLIFGKGGAMEALLNARDEGRVRFLGITGHHDPAMLLEAMHRFDFDTVLVALNAADRHRLSFLETVLPEAEQRGLGAIAMKVYAQGAILQSGPLGRLLGKTGLTPEEALGYCLSLPGVSTAIIGCKTPAEVDENVRIACRFRPFDDEQKRKLEERTKRAADSFTSYKKPDSVSLH
jgi:aryl-alcohol dehydrogenase-like predicted oxidoreductase